jgi:hypothetical protein
VPLTQTEINDAVLRLLDGDYDHLQLLRDGIAKGEIIAQAGGTGFHLRAAPPDSPFTRALVELRITAGNPPSNEIAEKVGISAATVSRLFAGNRRGYWPTIRLVVEYLGGNPADYRQLWLESKLQ